MSTRALSLVVRLLTTACAGAALGTISGCPLLFSCPEPWSALETVELGTTADILALTRGAEFDAVVAVGVGGIVVHRQGSSDPTTSNPVNVDLRGVIAFANLTVVVGDGGTLLVTADQGTTWEVRNSGVVDDLLGVARGTLEAGNFLVAISAGQILLSSDEGTTWSVVPPPVQGWGVLRAVFATEAELWVVGDAGVAWSSSDPAAAWTMQNLGTDVANASLLGGGRVSGDDGSSYASTVALVSSAGLWFRESGSSEWLPSSIEFDGEIVAYGGGFVLTSAGSIYDVDELGQGERVAGIEFDGRAITGNWDGFVVAGDGGQAARAYVQECIGGRPWVVGGEPTTANLVGEIPSRNSLDDELGSFDHGFDHGLDHELARAWARDGLVEHASVAAFARVIADLLSIGAPIELIRATQQAIADELEHARLCFDLASRHAGTVLGPGSLPLLAKPSIFGTVSDSRAGDPVAIALAMLQEGCINESVAAAEAAVAASQCRESRTKAVLERIAADETRHAALAWRTLRWLLDTHSEVAPALRMHFLQPGQPGLRPVRPMPRDTTRPTLRHHGRLTSLERATIRLRVSAEMIAPLAAALLHAPVVTSGLALA